jgi:hypothetical protein
LPTIATLSPALGCSGSSQISVITISEVPVSIAFIDTTENVNKKINNNASDFKSDNNTESYY